ncbi:MAG: thioredoxin domain-containing protein [Sphingopyxis sp.]|uniref:DsbA family protein n=1 Tax=Sphingopyxis sp. TaxID=1908224 RepID=UPI002ABAAD59|nr:thioredoxin domain-containing protein [Sphingopyxis sp.]MDZ3830555.1 thioredoxin domain-containing protein [Sphingopyxis sp.]
MPAALPRRVAIAALSAGALTLLAAAAPWSTMISTSAIGAHVVGNPAAKVRLIEYYSYTCSHCAHFAALAAAPLKSQYVDKGLVVVEYRNLVRDPVDMTAALLARCGGERAFMGNHQAIFAAQPSWLGKVQKASEAQMQSWYEGSVGERAHKIANDTGLAALMHGRGYSPAQLNACLNSEVAQAELTAMTNIGQNADRVRATPTFFINGRQTDANQWPALKTPLDLALKGS